MRGTTAPAIRSLERIKRTALAAGVLAVVAPAAWGQALEEVVVTAERREASIQDTPVSVVAFSGREIEELGVTNLKDLQNFIPGLSIGGFSDGDTEPDWYIRGVGGGDARTKGVGLYIDEVYYASANGSLLDVVDVERVEVLRGPQGTLFGRNTTGGLLHFVTVKPQPEFGGQIRGNFGSYDRADLSAVVNVPINDKVLTRFTAASLKQGGYVKQANGMPDLGDKDTDLVRAQFRFLPTDSLTVDLSHAYIEYDDHGAAQVAIKISQEPTTIGNLFESQNPDLPEIESFSDSDCIVGNSNDCVSPGSDLDQSREGRLLVTTLTTTWDITDNLTLKAITGLIDVSAYQVAADWDGLPLPIWSSQDAKDDEETFSQELQFLGESFDGFLSWQTGVYFSKLRQNNYSTTVRCCGFASSGGPTGGADIIRSSNVGVYGDATASLTDRLSFSFGGRYTKDELEHQVLDAVDWNEFIWRANIQYDLSDDVMVYASAGTGYRAGGVSRLCDNPVPQCYHLYGAETLVNREIGLRSTWLDRRLRMNLTYFDMTWRDRQVQTLTIDPESETGVVATTENIGKAALDGIELETSFLAGERFTLSAAASVLDADILQGGAPGSTLQPGDEMPRAPKLNYRIGGSYTLPLDNGAALTFRSDLAFTDKQRSFPTPTNSDIIPSYKVVQARVEYESPDGRWSVAGYCTNCADERYWMSAFDNRGVYQIETGQLGRPREFGVALRMDY
ncbi:MAG: TonB-dependent receptor [Gammaproteobacteria bacterium]